MARTGKLGRAAVAAAIAALALVADASSASASVTIGQLGPPGVPVSCVGSTLDQLQQQVTNGAGYVVPGIPPATNLIISSWSHQAAADPSDPELTMKVFRKVAEPGTYQVVGHDGPRTLAPGVTNSFRTSILVQPGDVLGLNSAIPAATACNFESIGNTGTSLTGPSPSNLADGESAPFTGVPSDRLLNISAVVTPANSFNIQGIKRHPRRGTATITVEVPNPGQIEALSNSVKTVGGANRETVASPGTFNLLVAAKGQKAARLRRTGRVLTKLSITYIPANGEPSQQTRSLPLRLR
jgi:hypothetical protein